MREGQAPCSGEPHHSTPTRDSAHELIKARGLDCLGTRSLMASPPAWLFALVFRLLNALCSRAFFQPDEYWQNLEVAHRWIYGYGYQTWEWRTLATSSSAATARTSTAAGPEWGKATSTWADVLRTGGQGGIRSPLSVAGTALVYAVLKVTSLDNGALLASRLFPLLFLAGRIPE